MQVTRWLALGVVAAVGIGAAAPAASADPGHDSSVVTANQDVSASSATADTTPDPASAEQGTDPGSGVGLGPASAEWAPDVAAPSGADAAAAVVADAPESGPVTISTVQTDSSDPSAAPVIVAKTLPSKDAAQQYAASQLTKKSTVGVEVSVKRSALAVPSDPKGASQYQHDPGQLDTVAAWATTQGQNVKVAVIDTGVDGTHEDLKGRVLKGMDFTTPAVGTPGGDGWNDDFGHGTHVAGIIAANANNGVGVAGVAPKVSVLPVRVLGVTGSGSSTQEARGIVWAVDQGAKVINLSLGGPYSFAEDAAIRYAVQHDVVVVAAMGNDSGLALTDGPDYPAALPDVTGVAALTKSKNRASYSSISQWVDVAAPGDSIVSTEPGNKYGPMSGTSMASPMVAGVAALVRAAKPSLTQAQVRAIVAGTANDVLATGRDDQSGYGEVSASAAVAAAKNGQVPQITTPSVTVNRKPNPTKDPDDTEFNATLTGQLGAGEHGLGIYEDGTTSLSLYGADSGYGTNAWHSQLWGDGTTADYYIGFPGDDLHNAAFAGPISITYGKRAVKPYTLAVTAAARTTSCGDLSLMVPDLESCFKINVKATTKDGSPAVGTINAVAGELDADLGMWGDLTASGSSWSGTVLVPDFDPEASDDAVISAYAPAQDISSGYQIKQATSKSLTLKGKPNPPAKPSMRLTYKAAGAAYSAMAMTNTIELTWGQCVSVSLSMIRSDGAAATGNRTVGAYGQDALSQPDAVPQWTTLKPSADRTKWTGTMKYCPTSFSDSLVLYFIYPGSSTEASSTAAEPLVISTTKPIYTGSWSTSTIRPFRDQQFTASGTFKPKAGPTEQDYQIDIVDSKGNWVDSAQAYTVTKNAVSFTWTSSATKASEKYQAQLSQGTATYGKTGLLTVNAKPLSASKFTGVKLSARKLTFGKRDKLTATLWVAGVRKANTKVRFCASSAIQPVVCRTVKTNGSGKVTADFRPLRTEKVWFQYLGASGVRPTGSAKKKLTVNLKITAMNPKKGVLKFRCAPNAERHAVVVYKYNAAKKKWVIVKKTKSSATGYVMLRYAKAGKYKAVYKANQLNGQGTSRVVKAK